MINFKIGIDEAGRGPVIGDLVIALTAIDENSQEILEDLELKESLLIKDSKKLSPKMREKIFNKLEILKNKLYKRFYYDFISVSPKEIDEKNLNELEAEKMILLIKRFLEFLDKNIGREKIKINVFIDLPEKKEKFENRIRKYLSSFKYHKNIILNFNLEHKSDEKYKIVSLASIIAKYQRDRILEKIKEELADLGDLGSAYPSDSLTKEFLKRNFKNERVLKFIRKKWKSYLELLDRREREELERKFFPEKFKKKSKIRFKNKRNKKLLEFISN